MVFLKNRKNEILHRKRQTKPSFFFKKENNKKNKRVLLQKTKSREDLPKEAKIKKTRKAEAIDEDVVEDIFFPIVLVHVCINVSTTP